MPSALRRLRLAALGAGLLGSASPALAIDTFTLAHVRNACAQANFVTTHIGWSGRSRILFQRDEVIKVTLYGHGADFAQDATGSNIREWISDKGTTDDYPNAPIIAGVKVKKGFVTVSIKAEPEDGLGDRTVTVRWPTGTETIPLRIVADCAGVQNVTYRTAVAPGSTGITSPLRICKPDPNNPTACP